MTIKMELQDKNLQEVNIKKDISIKPYDSGTKKKKFNIKTFLLILIIALLLGGVAYAGYRAYLVSKNIGFKFDTNSIITKKPQLKKDSTNKYTNVMLIGIDTREKGELYNTDTIMLISYNHQTKSIVMLSIPRDLNVEIFEKSGWFERINAVYASAEKRSEGSGLEALKKTVQKITGAEIQYYAMVDFKAFTTIVDLVGGVDVNVENSFTDYSYPLGSGYQTVIFKAGPQTMDGDTALKFARSRHAQQNNEGTDYARARRQQKVIVALQEKILSSETLTNPRKVLEIISSLSNNVKISEFTIDDIEAGINTAIEFEKSNGKTFSFVLDPLSGNYQLVETKILPSGAFAIAPKQGLGVYTKINEYIQLVLGQPGIYSERPTIYIYDIGLGSKLVAEEVATLRKDYPYINIINNGTLLKDKEGTYVFSNTEDLPYTIDSLSKYLKTENKSKPEFITTKIGNGGVTILFGKEIQLNQE